MFIDHARLKITAGGGGNGCCSFRRELYVPEGGPNGGDGGDGGSVYLVADSRTTSLLDIKHHQHWKGKRGEHGQGSDCHGKRGEPTYIKVPEGTVVRNWGTGEFIADLTDPEKPHLVADGGKGGRGNARFLSNKNRAPMFAEKGEPGEERDLALELKIIAEIGLVGLPNAGKSTFLSRVTAATPKIADYPFTTLSPNLGVSQLSEYRTLTIADIPGIIEGAAEGKGLGHEFLRHIERTKVLVFLIDLGDPDPFDTLRVLEQELEAHSEVFATRPRFVVFNKCDVTEYRERFGELRVEMPDAYCISGVTGEGMAPLLEVLWNTVERLRIEEAEAASVAKPEPQVEYTYSAPYEIEATRGGFRVEGKNIERLMKMTDFTNDEAVRHMQHRLERMGLFKALKRLGAQEGQTILIGEAELEYRPD